MAGRLTVRRLREHCLGKPGAWPDNPFREDGWVVKVGEAPRAGKIFAFLGEQTLGVKLGTGRDEADEWLARYPGHASVMAYLGRSGWNTLTLGGAIPDDDILGAADESYSRVVAGLPHRHRPLGWEQA